MVIIGVKNVKKTYLFHQLLGEVNRFLTPTHGLIIRGSF